MSPRPAYDRWRDAGGVHIPAECHVEQVEVDARFGALRSRRGKRSTVVGRGATRLLVCSTVNPRG